jgi:hypothetical protein
MTSSADALGKSAATTVAFATSHRVANPLAGDLATARDFGAALAAENGWTVVYLDRADADWYDLSGVDVLVALLDQYELPKIRNAKPGLVRVAWARNWFDRWAARPWFGQYDLILSSSEKGAAFFAAEQPFAIECSLRCDPPEPNNLNHHSPFLRVAPLAPCSPGAPRTARGARTTTSCPWRCSRSGRPCSSARAGPRRRRPSRTTP